MERSVAVETLSELQIWIEGKFELLAQAQKSANDDLTNVRRTVHDLNNQMTVIIALNLPEKIASLQKADEDHETNIKKFIEQAAERKGAVAALKAVYAIVGTMIGFSGAVALQFYQSLQG